MSEESPEHPSSGVGQPAVGSLRPAGMEGPVSPDAASPSAESSPSGWTYWDLLLLLLLSVPALIFSIVVTVAGYYAVKYGMGSGVELEEVLGSPLVAVVTHFVWWAILLSFMYAVITVKYRLPFGDSIGWRRLGRPGLHTALYCWGGVALAFSVGAIASVISMPTEPLPIEQLLKDRQAVLVFAVFGVLIAPPVEEMAFRGFLYPVVERSYGKSAAVLVTSAIFSALHGWQYGWHWQILLLLLYVGIVFGVLRARTGSLVPSTLVHCAYNATLFAALIFGADEFQRMH